MPLTEGKRKFAEAVAAGNSNRDAAIIAGYKPRSAAQAGSRMAKDPFVTAYIGRLIASSPDLKNLLKNEGELPEPEIHEFKISPQDDPKEFLMSLMNNQEAEFKMRFEAARALMPFMHARVGESGKKENKKVAAKTAGKGRFSAGDAPLRAVK